MKKQHLRGRVQRVQTNNIYKKESKDFSVLIILSLNEISYLLKTSFAQGHLLRFEMIKIKQKTRVSPIGCV